MQDFLFTNGQNHLKPFKNARDDTSTYIPFENSFAPSLQRFFFPVPISLSSLAAVPIFIASRTKAERHKKKTRRQDFKPVSNYGNNSLSLFFSVVFVIYAAHVLHLWRCLSTGFSMVCNSSHVMNIKTDGDGMWRANTGLFRPIKY